MNIAFLIGSCEIAGGNYVVLQHADHLRHLGHSVSLIHLFSNPDIIWHPAQKILRFVPIEKAKQEEFDIIIATWWGTVRELSRLKATRFVYFVQSIESWYCPDEAIEIRRAIDATYLAPLPIITEARWIQEYLHKEFGRRVWLAPNGIRKDFLSPHGPVCCPRQPGKLRALVEGPIGIDFKNVPRSILLARLGGADEVWWLTSSNLAWYPGVDRVFSRVPIDRVGEIYRSCDVLIKLSYVEGMFGPPLEMFHCGGTAIVYNITGADEYIVHEWNAIACTPGDETGILRSLKRLKETPDLLNNLQQHALETAQNWPDWSIASKSFADALEKICNENPCPAAAIESAVRLYPVPLTKLTKKKFLWNTVRRFLKYFSLINPYILPMYYYCQYLVRKATGKRNKKNSLSL